MSNYTKFPNWLLDEALPHCEANEWRVICHIVRETCGWNRETAKISMSNFLKATKIGGKSTLMIALHGVIDKGYIARTESGMGYEYRLASPETGLVLKQDMSQNRTATSPEIGQEVVLKQDSLPPALKKEKKDKEREIDPVILLAGYFTELTALFPRNGSYVDEWEIPLTVLYKNVGNLEGAKMKLKAAWEYARNPKGRNRPFIIRSPLSLSTIIANLPAGSNAPETTIKVRSR